MQLSIITKTLKIQVKIDCRLIITWGLNTRKVKPFSKIVILPTQVLFIKLNAMPILQIPALQSYFTRQTTIQRAYLFGSYARGNADENSDVDIVIELQKPISLSLLDLATMQIELSDQLNLQVDLITTDGISRHIQPFIDKEKILIYER